MVTVASMKKSLERAVVSYQEFALHTKQYADGLFCFFEGSRGGDNTYYVPRIKRFTENYHPIRCGDRDAVIKTHELISAHEEYDKYKKGYFIDRDFNPPLGDRVPPIYETPCYSIENFYVSLPVFEEIVSNFLNISKIHADFTTCIKRYYDLQIQFHEAVTLFNAWYACLMDLRISTGQAVGARLDDKLPNGFIEHNLTEVIAHYNLAEIGAKFHDAPVIAEDVINKKIQEFNQLEKGKVFRGKYELQFLIKMIALILDDSKNKKQFLTKEVKYNFANNVSNEQALGIFSSYAESPQCLVKYLETVCA